jgi:hypothetical protein
MAERDGGEGWRRGMAERDGGDIAASCPTGLTSASSRLMSARVFQMDSWQERVVASAGAHACRCSGIHKRDPMGEIQWEGSNRRDPMGEIQWEGSNGRDPMGEIQWEGSNGRDPMEGIQREGSNGRDPTGGIQWKGSNGRGREAQWGHAHGDIYRDPRALVMSIGIHW